MKLPIWIISMLPEKWQEKHITNMWDEKTGAAIGAAYEDATEWIWLSQKHPWSSPIADIAANCETRLEKYILPQMRKRGMITQQENNHG